MKVAVVGGTGEFGRALAERLFEARFEVVVGSRDLERALDVASAIGVRGRRNEDAVREVDLVVLAVKAEAALDTARELADAIGGTPTLSVASALQFSKRGVRPRDSMRSLAEETAEILRGPVVAGLHSLAASTLAQRLPEQDALVCGDDADAKALAIRMATTILLGGAYDAGPLENARALEGMTAVILNLNRRYRGHAGLRVVGLP